MPNSETLLRSLLRLTILAFAVLLVLWVAAWVSALVMAAKVGGTSVVSARLNDLTGQLGAVTAAVWAFARPILQLVILLLVLEWVLGRLGVSAQAEIGRMDWNAATVITIVVVGALVLAVLAGIPGGAAELKDVAFVVIGFYFGAQRFRS